MTLSSNFGLPLPAQPANPQVTPRGPGARPETEPGTGKSFGSLVSDQAQRDGQTTNTVGNPVTEASTTIPTDEPVLETPSELNASPPNESEGDAQPDLETGLSVIADASVDAEDSTPVSVRDQSTPFGQTVRQQTPSVTGEAPPETGVTPSGKVLPDAALKADTTGTGLALSRPVAEDAVSEPALPDDVMDSNPTLTLDFDETAIDGQSTSTDPSPSDPSESVSTTASQSASTPDPVSASTVSANSVQPTQNADEANPQSATPAQPNDKSAATPAQPVSDPSTDVKAPAADLKADNRKSNAFTNTPDGSKSDNKASTGQSNTGLEKAMEASNQRVADQSLNASNNIPSAAAKPSTGPLTFIQTLVPDQSAAGQILTENGAEAEMEALLPFRSSATAQNTLDARQASQLAARMGPAHIQTVAARIAQRFNEGARVFDIRLDPPSLGRVDVRLELGPDNRVSAIMTAEKADALAELQRSARDLARSLAEAGMELSQDDLSFQLGGRQADDQTDSEQPGWQQSNAPIFVDSQTEPGLTVTDPGQAYGFALKNRTALNVQI